VVSEIDGSWGAARLVPGLARLDKGPASFVDIVSCVSAGNCIAAGAYQPVPDRAVGPVFGELFVVSQVRGALARGPPAARLRVFEHGPSGLDRGAVVYWPGRVQRGRLLHGHGRDGPQEGAFVVSEVRGRWLRAREAPGTAALSTGGEAQLASLFA